MQLDVGMRRPQRRILRLSFLHAVLPEDALAEADCLFDSRRAECLAHRDKAHRRRRAAARDRSRGGALPDFVEIPRDVAAGDRLADVHAGIRKARAK